VPTDEELRLAKACSASLASYHVKKKTKLAAKKKVKKTKKTKKITKTNET
jgi:hypothetical protein